MGGWDTVHGTESGVTPEEANDLAAAGALLLDVREAFEWEAGHVPGSRHVPLGELAARLEALPRDRSLVVVCRSGHRSAHATTLLVGSGFSAVNLEGGLQAWAGAGLPIESGDGRSGSVA